MAASPAMMLLAAGLLAASAPPAPAPGPADILAAAPASAWVDVDPDTLLVMTLDDGGRVVIQLAERWAPVHAANLRRLAAARWWDGTAVSRVQDNYVVQWGEAGAKPLPAAVVAAPPPEYDRPVAGVTLRATGYRDSYASVAGHDAGGWPVGSDGRRAWLAHCYGMVGVGREMPPDTGSGAELYAVIGQGPRHLDRNIALVGRVLDGMERLASLRRGTAPLGFYAHERERTRIAAVRLAAEMAPGERPHWQILDPSSDSFARWREARANRRDAFFVRPAGGADLCNLPVPTRERPKPL